MIGNAAEICWGTDGLGFNRNPECVFARCGGHFLSSVHVNKVHKKYSTSIESRKNNVGLRVVVELEMGAR